MLAVVPPLVIAACVRCETPTGQGSELTVMSYNLQTLFDPVDQGGEYEEFRVSKGTWGEARYGARIAALASVILSASFPGGDGRGPDLLVAQEAENPRVLRDLAEAAGGYPYIAASPEEEATLACGVLSRYPIADVKAHRVRKPDGAPSSVPRFVLEADIDVDGKRLVVLAAHWKSKLGGAAETEPERRAAAAFLSALVALRLREDPALALIIAGDLNENPDEYERAGRAYPTGLMPPEAGPGPWLLVSGDRDEVALAAASAAGSSAGAVGQPVLFSPWDEGGGYSYRFEGEDERIDQLILSPSLVLAGAGAFYHEEFSSVPPEFAVGADGAPLGWNAKTGSGYSDHLPVRIRLSAYR
jgi:endonuclease/exonuclease/phosphatase family metal-dependent hydrolase